MADVTTTPNPSNEKAESIRIFLIVAYIFMFFFPFVSAIIAYIKRGESEGTVYQSHFSYLLRTFWVGFFLLIVPIFLVPILFGSLYLSPFSMLSVVIGFVSTIVYFVVFLWCLVRVVFGLIKAFTRETVKAKTWLV
ncbi:hypothetical protein GVX81_07350 [[Haemophilus] felis]|uniref:DUF4870 domain-containing protein n=1 Tax=[Haemophilus] felis TaxID=123822 RepID=A0A1T0AXJ4_9PAST|nr:hypothetical protein [[Haemophilus] felis]OOS02597.1 hypothetical protein B0188_08160 [[Haemophilus] felis]